MKTHVNLSIEKELIKQVKVYAQKKQTSVSDLVEEYFHKIVRPTPKANIIDMIEELETPAIDKSLDLKKAYYEQQSAKHGF
jgi:hypothetical protein